ncbi:unnamed protein product, partial [Ectocarpus sp. 4 AP-2014]
LDPWCLRYFEHRELLGNPCDCCKARKDTDSCAHVQQLMSVLHAAVPRSSLLRRPHARVMCHSIRNLGLRQTAAINIETPPPLLVKHPRGSYTAVTTASGSESQKTQLPSVRKEVSTR